MNSAREDDSKLLQQTSQHCVGQFAISPLNTATLYNTFYGMGGTKVEKYVQENCLANIAI